LGELLSKYFAQVEIIPGNSQNYAICRLPKQLSIAEYETALSNEFNMEYPNNFKHNRHEALVKYLIDLVRERNVSSN
jgi:ParB family chromosome partitioning protein